MKKKKLNVTTGQTGSSDLFNRKPIKKEIDGEAIPQMVSFASDVQPGSSMRRNIAGSIERTNKYINIEQGLVPFRYSSSIYGSNLSSIDVRDAVVLCQKCYYNFALFRNIIDLMTEFSVGELTYKGGSKQSRDFFKALWNKINIWDLQDKFFREYYRSGNIFLYRFDADLKPDDIKKITQVFATEYVAPNTPKYGTYMAQEGANPDKLKNYLAPTAWTPQAGKLIVEKMRIPAKYIILNPADIQMMSTLNFAYGIYFKIMTDYEIAQLRNPKNEQDIAIFNDLPPEIQKQIKVGSRVISIPLDPTRISMVFYKRQDYEPFAVPMGFPVLEDINFKAEMRKIDMAIARTMQQIVLLVTAGAKPEEGGVNQRNMDALRKLFENQSVGRVLIADYTTKAEFVIPAIGDLLDPKKYEIINEDINIGLNNVFAGNDKFANQQQRVELFISRLEQGRKAFINSFLLPEMKRIAHSIGFKNYPSVEFESIDLKDNSVLNKIYGRLMEIGVLTPEQGFKAISTGILPDPELMQEAQEEYKDHRDKGLYTPLIGGGKGQDGKGPMSNGKPIGGGAAPKITNKISPIGTKASEDSSKYSVMEVKNNMVIAQNVEEAVVSHLKEKFGIKRMSKLQKEVATGTVEMIMANEEPSKWLTKVKDYCEKPEDTNHNRVCEVNKIAIAHQIDNYLASLLLASRIE